MPDIPRFEIHEQGIALPVQPGERIAFVDILRGFAIFGILVANMAAFSGHSTDVLAPLVAIDRWVLILTRFFITAKFYSLFSFLFGWGLSVQMARAEARGTNFVSLYSRRLVVLLLIGIFHAVLIWSGDILTIYAIFGFLLLLIRNRSERTLLILMVFCLLLPIFLSAPWKASVEIVSRYEDLTSFLRLDLAPPDAYTSGSYLEITRLRVVEYLGALSLLLIYFGNVFAMFLLGFLVGKRRIFREIDQSWSLMSKIMVGGLIIGVVGNALYVWLILHPTEMPAALLPQSYHQMLQHIAYTLGAPALMLYYVSGLILLLRRKYWHDLLSPLANVGRMALSNYLLQSILVTLIFYNYGLGLYGEISPFIGLVLTVIIFLAQIRISIWWFDRYPYGPVERVWRFLTYGKSPLSRSVTTGIRGEKPAPIKRIPQFIKQLHPAWILSVTWIVLLVWAGLLIVWYQQVQVARHAPTLRLVSASSTAKSEDPQSVVVGRAGEEDQISIPNPPFQQASYQPGKIAASGDIEALVGTFDLEKALSEIETLTGAPYWGRHAGSPQGWAAGDYLSSQFSRFGLQPLGDQGTYFQEFPVLYTPLETTPSLYLETSLDSSPEQFTAYQDFSPVVRWYAGSGAGKGKVYWLNHCTKEDFATQDVVGKVLLCIPEIAPNWLEQISRRALEHGAAALLLLLEPETRPPDFGWSFKDVWVPEPLPLFFVYPEMVARFLSGSGKTVADLQANLQPFLLESTVGFKIKTQHSSSCPGPKCSARNVVGILPGRDPHYAREVVILGAHYDHMGQAPNGIVWPGANDDASGVAVLLEIARSWKEQGYIPKRSVIFAAWDAEELGLLGAIHFVNNPPFKLENPVAMIQLDMIGAGSETLNIDGDTPLSEKIKFIAETLGFETNVTDIGGSDHTPFLSTGIPASALMWESPADEESNYHRPTDTIQAIEGERLRSAAHIAELTLLNLAESEPSLHDLLAKRARAAQQGDIEAFLLSSHPDQVQADSYWFEDLQSMHPEHVSLEANNLLVAGNLASANVHIKVDYLEPSQDVTRTLTASIPVSFTHTPSGWQWSGLHLVWSEAETSLDNRTVFKLGYPSGKVEGVSGVGRSAIETYLRLTDLLGLSPEVQARLFVLPDEETLWGSTALSQPRNQDVSVIPGEVKLVYQEAISTSLRLQDALAQLVLAEAGVSEAVAPWLWQGLPLVIQSYDRPVVIQTQFIPVLQERLGQGSPPPGLVSSWAATAYLQERLGWPGLGRFILRLGQTCQDGCNSEQALDAALLEFVSLDAAGFETAWQNAWKIRLETAQSELDTLLSRRNMAVSNGDIQAFLATIDPSVPKLDIEERHWLEDFINSPPQGYSVTGRPLAFMDGGSLLAEITIENQPAGGDQKSTLLTAWLTPSEIGYDWAGSLMKRMPGERVDILYTSGKADLAAVLLNQTEQIASRLASILNIPKTDKVIIKLYDTPDSYRASISPSLTQTFVENTWTRPGESIKLNIGEARKPEVYTSTLANQLARSLLYQSGCEAGWLVEGISAYLSRPYAIESGSPPAWLQFAELFEVARSGTMLALNDILPTIRLSSEELGRSRNVSRDAVDFLVTNYGWPALLEILDIHESGASLEGAFRASLGITLEQFEQDWRGSLLQKHIRPEWVVTAQTFLPGRAMESVDYLASPTLQGRLAGSPGSVAAAQYIAEAFEAYGILPAGDLITDTVGGVNPVPTILGTNPVSATLHTYFQTFPISYTDQVPSPRLELLDETGKPSLSLTYRQDYLLIQGDACSGAISAPLVWGGDQAYPDIDLKGKILLRTSRSNLPLEINAAVSQGAAGLLLTSNRREPEELFAKQPIAFQETVGESIPVFELTQPGYSRLLEALDYDRQTISILPAFQPLGRLIRFDCSPDRFETVQTANVLGLLPGSDPYLSQEVIILGAHYDHVGDDPGGLRFSGANDNASGVAVLLEIARLLHEQGYHPKRSILFAAWEAQELGQVGSTYYVTHPPYPLHDTIAMIQLDGVGGGDGFNLGVQGSPDTDGELLFYLGAAEQAMQEKLVYTPLFGVSDDTPFRQEGLPAVLISWRLANEHNLPDELGNAVRTERLAIAGRVVTLLIQALAR